MSYKNRLSPTDILNASGTPSSSTYLRGDNTWATPSGGGGGGLPDGDYGDITVGGSGTTLTIDNDAVTYAKLQNISATDKILGRVSSGAGNAEEVAFTDQAQQLCDDASFAAMRATLATLPALDTMSASLGTAYLATLEITSGTYDGAWRYLGAGGVNWYFLFAAMVLAPEQFTAAHIQAAVETALNVGVVGPRENSAAYTANMKVQFDGKVFFCNIAGTTAGSAPSTAGAVNAGDFIGDGTVTWEYTGVTVPSTWQWFLIDISSDLFTVVRPDSNDAYAGVLIAAADAAGVSSSWLSTASAFPSKTRLQLLRELADECITDEIANNLSYTFQDQTKGDGSSYNIQFLADNCEAWRGLKSLANLYTTAGDSANASTANTNAATLRTGILALWDSGSTRFKTYYGQTGYESLAGDAAFVSDLRFHIWPLLHGVITSNSDIATYGDAVAGYTVVSVPNVWNGSLDTFPMGEWYFAIARKYRWFPAADVLRRRVLQRSGSTATITDVSVCLSIGSVISTDISDSAVTYAKMQNVSATQRVLGRNTAGAGVTEEVTLSQLLDWIGSAAQGDILYRGASGWARLAAGTSGQFLQTAGAGANPTWATSSGSNPWTLVRKSSDESRSSNSTLANDGALLFSMSANTKYSIRGRVFFDTASTPDFKYSFTGPASPTRVRVARYGLDNGSSSTTGISVGTDTAYGTISTQAGSGASGYVWFEGIIENGANTGNFAFQWAQNTSNATNTTVLAGSYLEWSTY